MFNSKLKKGAILHTLLLFQFILISDHFSLSIFLPSLNKKIKEVTILVTSFIFQRNDIISSSYRFLQILVPCSSYSKLYKDLATINLVDLASKL